MPQPRVRAAGRLVAVGTKAEIDADLKSPHRMLRLLQERLGSGDQCLAVKQEMPAGATHLSPQHGGPDAGQKKHTHLVGHPGLLQVLILANHLDAEGKRAYGVGINRCDIGDDVFMSDAKMLDLMLALA